MLSTVALALALGMSTAVAQQYGGERQSGGQARGSAEQGAQAQAPREPVYDAATGRMQQPPAQSAESQERAQQGQQQRRQGAQAADQRQPGAQAPQTTGQAPQERAQAEGARAPQEGARAPRQGQRQVQPGAQAPQTTGQAAQEAPRGAQAPRATAEGAQAPSGARGAAALNEQQRTQISSLISRENVRPLGRVNFAVSVGTVVPRSVRLHPLSADIVAIVPQFRGHRFFVVEDEIVIVEPSTLRIVAVIPRRVAAAPTTRASSRLQLTQQQRASIRTHVLRDSPRITTRETIVIGEPVPSAIELRTFPQAIVTDIPILNPFRFFVQDRDVVLVDPGERRVVEVIR
jgi:hypothetical protein